MMLNNFKTSLSFDEYKQIAIDLLKLTTDIDFF